MTAASKAKRIRNLTLEERRLIVASHPAQRELDRLNATMPNSPFALFVRQEREVFAMQTAEMLEPAYQSGQFDRESVPVDFVTEFLYNRQTERGKTLIAARFLFREFVNLPELGVGATSTTEFKIKGISWKDLARSFGSNFVSSKSASRKGGRKRSPASKRRSR